MSSARSRPMCCCVPGRRVQLTIRRLQVSFLLSDARCQSSWSMQLEPRMGRGGRGREWGRDRLAE